MVLVIDNYDSFTYNLVQLIGKLGYQLEVRRNDQLTIAEIKELNPEKIVISPGPGRPEEAGISLQVVKQLAGQIPILGVCLGHQVIAQAFGAEIEPVPELVHGKTALVKPQTDSWQQIGEFKAARYHSLAVSESSLPANFEITLRTKAGLLMGIEDRKQQLYGFQFHPESVMTEAGEKIIETFLTRGVETR